VKAALIYGTCTGRTEYVAEQIIEALKPEIELEMVDVYKIKAADLAQWEFMLCGIPTWDVGELEYGWADVYDNLDDVDLPNSTVAMYGLGDQGSYADTYQDAMGILYKKLLERGARGGIGFTPTDSHEFDESLGVIDGQFCGLAIDEDNQEDLTEERIEEWAKSMKEAWPGIVEAAG
jgi:flavodoxin I